MHESSCVLALVLFYTHLRLDGRLPYGVNPVYDSGLRGQKAFDEFLFSSLSLHIFALRNISA